ncbi:ATP-binding protein [Dechloromonas sp. ZY10]|uniref:HAMP domain-containing sensor histidine kinase n=1 Tax=Dechloromonas aquae TaxID=2664436 RepID=UPI00352784AA
MFWRFFLIVWLAQLAAVLGTGVVFWLEHRSHLHPPPVGPGGPRVEWPGPPPGPPPERRPGRSPGDFHVPLVPALLGFVASLVCAGGLAWSVARPLRAIRKTVAEVASGNLDARVGAAMRGRNDELAELGRDLDCMAGRLQGLVLGQRRLLHDVSHEMRSPLARLQAAIGLARQQPERAAELLERIEREGERLDVLVGEVLALARAEAGAARAETFNLGELLRQLVDDASFEGCARQVEVSLRCPEGLWVKASPELLQAAIDNVVRNGLRFSPVGGCLALSCERQGGRLSLQIADQGPGVSEDLLPHIFSPFVRADTGAMDGYGLGLAIARRAVEAAGGEVFAANREEGGLCVTLFLPEAMPPQPESAGLSV